MDIDLIFATALSQSCNKTLCEPLHATTIKTHSRTGVKGHLQVTREHGHSQPLIGFTSPKSHRLLVVIENTDDNVKMYSYNVIRVLQRNLFACFLSPLPKRPTHTTFPMTCARLASVIWGAAEPLPPGALPLPAPPLGAAPTEEDTAAPVSGLCVTRKKGARWLTGSSVLCGVIEDSS